MRKVSLLSPGPTPVPQRTLLAMAQPLIHHRAPDFKIIFQKVRDGLKMVFDTKNEVLVFNSSGTGVMESSVANLLSPGDKAIFINGGKFGERWGNLLKAYNCQPVEINVPWGYAVNPDDVAKTLKGDSTIRAIYVQTLETSTGVEHPVRELAQIARNSQALLVVDAVSSLGATPIPMDEWGIDVLLAGSQKALMMPPGLAFAGLGPRALEMMKTSTLPKFYFSWARELKNQIDNKGAFTSPVSMFFGLIDVFEIMREDGMPRIYADTALRSQAFKAAVAAWGLTSYAKQNPSNAITAVECPPNIDGEAVVKWLRDKYSIYIAGGQDAAKGKIFRVAHMGYINAFDILQVTSALEMALSGLGHKFTLGSGVAAAQKVFGENK
jgi:aspartate aminotransferase-like enzyme